MKTRLSRKELIEDIRQLTNTIETAHPEPYFKGGGRIAYHRRLQGLIRDIPEEGITAKEFNYALMPFVASLKDGHTTVFDEKILDGENPGGIPLQFGVIEDQIYVRACFDENHKDLIGSVLVSVAGVGVAKLTKRVRKLFGCENQFQVLGKLCTDPSLLLYEEALKLLIPDWQENEKIAVELQHPNGPVHTYHLEPIKEKKEAVKYAHPTHLDPPTAPGNPFFYSMFIDETGHAPGETAYLRIANMITSREVFEVLRANGMDYFDDLRGRVYKRFHPDSEIPGNYDEEIADIPAIAEVFESLLRSMKEKGTQHLIVDLRNNQGGNDIINRIFTYYLAGVEKTIELMKINGTVRKISKFLDATTDQTIDFTQIPYNNQVPLEVTDYDFSLDPAFSDEEYEKEIRAKLEEEFAKIPAFNLEYQSRQNEALYFPEHIIILCSELTFSTGYNLMVDLYHLGGKIIGIPSGQAGNSCGDIRFFELDHSKIKGSVSTKSFTAFPDDPEAGKLLMPHFPLSYEKLAEYHFDENAILRFALEVIKKSM